MSLMQLTANVAAQTRSVTSLKAMSSCARVVARPRMYTFFWYWSVSMAGGG